MKHSYYYDHRYGHYYGHDFDRPRKGTPGEARRLPGGARVARVAERRARA